MTTTSSAPPRWWTHPRRITVLVDNPSWVLPFAERLAGECVAAGDEARVARAHEEMLDGGIAFLIGCTRVIPAAVLARNHRNLVVHASDLPQGRGFSPMAWQIQDGASEIPICLFEAVPEFDNGPVVYRDRMRFEGHELLPELRATLGEKTLALCRRFLAEPCPPAGEPQQGVPSYYRRRTDADNQLDPRRTIAEQFDRWRVADNARFPAHFELRGHRYVVRIEKASEGE